jgi:hypothetical protein
MANYIKNYRQFRLNEDLNSSYDWPKWMPDMGTQMLLFKAAGSPSDDAMKSYFVTAAKSLADLELKLTEQGWTKSQVPAGAYSIDMWKRSQGDAMKSLAAKNEEFMNLWTNNVESNLKESAWNSPDKGSIHISTWESFEDWANNSSDQPGIRIRKCDSVKLDKWQHCNAKPIVWNGGELNF